MLIGCEAVTRTVRDGMLSFRPFQGIVWTLMGFMLVAALVLDMRYRALDDGTGYLDTWTGEIRSTTDHARIENDRVEVRVPNPVLIPKRLEIVVPDPVVMREKLEVRVPEPVMTPAPLDLRARALESRAYLDLMERARALRAERPEESSVRFAFPAPLYVYRFR